MQKFKLKKIKGTNTQKGVVTIILLAIIALLVYSAIPDSNTNITTKVDYEAKKVIKSLNFPGKEESTLTINDKYVEATYINKGIKESHIIDVNNIKEVEKEILIKDEEKLNAKIHELLLKVYPKFVVEELEKTEPNFEFREKDLYITYDKNKIKLNTKRNFYRIVDYNEIKDFLKFVPKLNEEYQIMDGYDYDKDKVTISITFDDGPNGNRTRRLIESLEDHKMSSTFFMLGSRYESNEDIVKLVYNSHSEVGYHNWEHTYYTTENKEQIINEFNAADKAFNKITGGHIKLTRPPYGDYNKETLEALPTAIIRWNKDTNDWRYKEFDYLTSYVLDNLEDGDIILFHDTYETSVTAALSLFDTLYLRDIQVVSVSTLAELKDTKLNAHEAYYYIK